MAEKKKEKTDRYVAYVGTYTQDKSKGIYVYDIDQKTGVLKNRSVAEINNTSHVCISKDRKFLYSIADEGVVAFSIDENGDLTKVNQAWTGGLRGCYISVDSKRRFLFVGGYHDGRVTVMKLNKDGSIGDIACGIFHQGVAISMNEHRLDHPKVTCVLLSPDEKYLFASDIGLNQIKVYRIDYTTGQLKLVDIVRCTMDAGPRSMRFSSDGRFLYVLTELNSCIEVYSYDDIDDAPLIRQIHTVNAFKGDYPTAECTSIQMNESESLVMVTVGGKNDVSFFKRNSLDGQLTYAFATPTSGDYPKQVHILPGDEYYVALNHDSNEIRTFRINYEGNYALMCNPPVKIDRPNCIRLLKLDSEG